MSSPSTKTAPYGSWKSPITSDLIVAQSITLSELCLDGGHVYWLEGRPQEQGRYVVVRAGSDGRPTDITPPPYNARTRVHEYGGGSWTVRNGMVYFSNFADGRLYWQVPGVSEPRALPRGARPPRCAGSGECTRGGRAASASRQVPRRANVGRLEHAQSGRSVLDEPRHCGARRELPRKHRVRPRLPRPSAAELGRDRRRRLRRRRAVPRSARAGRRQAMRHQRRQRRRLHDLGGADLPRLLSRRG